jgi:hypothetical protein
MLAGSAQMIPKQGGANDYSMVRSMESVSPFFQPQ